MPTKKFNAITGDIVVNTQTRSARIISVIQVATHGGLGTEDDPIRDVLEYWDMDGHLLFVCDAVQRNTVTFEPE